ncbi:hypothetical protein N7478_010330 [Penicillium angulare]|uniref:uncharacterized protein n=1 Tax=Penicillium angulare TaxID=116970 RepID=UPI0025423875|nr:uncharacterized protein N7478_010330 [Penicillium angulare]KAJ5267522.1 hypothetical protein N7478_010330 [Penicillium angulare]
MPYTAPFKSLLAAQHIEYCDPKSDVLPERPGLTRSTSPRLQNSRSYSSTSYVRRHRRSPSISKSSPVHTPESARQSTSIIDPHASLRQSPPPLSNAAIPPGAVISPPESAPNSDEESPYQSEGIKLEELEAAVKAIEQRKEHSPERMGPASQTGTEAQSSLSHNNTTPILTSKPSNHLRLSKEARKISHSRSSTESAISLRNEEALTSSPDESDAELSPRPPMVRKKSGELVRPALRPASARRRPSSMPGTPVYAKAVHFDSHLEHIRHFLQLDRPLAVSAETSPVDNYDTEGEFPFSQKQDKSPSWEWELRLPNFPKDLSARATIPVRLERLFLSGDKNVLVGSVAVANLAFHKHVAARFTFDYWRTVSEVSAVFCHDIRRKHIHDEYDRFSFEIKLDDQANLEKKSLSMCIRYTVNGQEHWDNNNGMNFQVDFHKALKVSTSTPNANKSSGGSRPSLPRSRTFTGSHTRPQSMPSSLDDFPELNKNLSFANPFASSKASPLTKAASDDIDTCEPPKRREKPTPQAFGNRYDFGASLTAAMRTKPPVDRTTLTTRARSETPIQANTARPVEKAPEPSPRESSPVSIARNGAPAENLKPSSLVSSKPCLESSVYKELVDKYCFYGTPKSASTKQTFSVNVPSEDARRFPSGTPSPPLSPGSPAPLEPPSPGHSSEIRSRSPAAISPRSSPRSSPSPMSHRYPYHQTLGRDS